MTDRRPISALRFDDRFVRTLPGDPSTDPRPRHVFGACFSPVRPTPVTAPKLVMLVPEVADLLGLEREGTAELVEVLAGNRVLPGMAPYAACYGGHQFGNWAGQLGDGRAITLGEVINPDNERWEIQLKGAGPTPYSRHADGRAVLRSSLRELVCSEAMHHLGVPTTRALSLVLTGDGVERDMLYDGHPRIEPGAITSRVAPSFLRFGSFQLHTSRRDEATLEKLAAYTLETFFPDLGPLTPESIAAFFEEVCGRTARLMVEWMRVGFVHGVMNTDNMSILGLTIDYGPYGWMDVFDPGWTPNTTDAGGRRYRFGHQPRIALWNLEQLANALVPLVGATEPLERGLETYASVFVSQQREMMLRKLGLRPGDAKEDDAFIASLFPALLRVETDMTLFFRRLADLDPHGSPAAHFETLREAWYAPDALTGEDLGVIGDWLDRYTARVRAEQIDPTERRAAMNATNPIYVPRNYLVQQVIDSVEAGDHAPLAELMDVFRHPYAEQPGREKFAAKRPEWARHKPGCSMLSCSS